MLLSETINSGFFYLAPWIVFFPVIGLLLNIIIGGRLPEKAIGWLASGASFAAFVVSVLLAYSVAANGGHGESVFLAEWMHIDELRLDWTFRVDSLSTTMMLVVSGVGTLIHIYAIGYMYEDVRFKNDIGRYRRFFVFLNLFIAAMMILVSGDSYLMLFVGWEGVGLCSFLLIGFWYEMDTLARPSWANSNAAVKAFITNRIGDFGFSLRASSCSDVWPFHPMRSLKPQRWWQLSSLHRCHHAFMLVGVRGIGADPALRLAAGRDGWPDPGLGADPCRDNGHGRRVPDHPLGAALHVSTTGAVHRGNDRRSDGALRCHDRGGAI
jgi:hypothetical protein